MAIGAGTCRTAGGYTLPAACSKVVFGGRKSSSSVRPTSYKRGRAEPFVDRDLRDGLPSAARLVDAQRNVFAVAVLVAQHAVGRILAGKRVVQRDSRRKKAEVW